jgi:hypothetical protein
LEFMALGRTLVKVEVGVGVTVTVAFACTEPFKFAAVSVNVMVAVSPDGKAPFVVMLPEGFAQLAGSPVRELHTVSVGVVMMMLAGAAVVTHVNVLCPPVDTLVGEAVKDVIMGAAAGAGPIVTPPPHVP